MRKFLVTGLAAFAAAACSDTPTDSTLSDAGAAGGGDPIAASAAESATRMYEVTVYNLTAGQPLTPPLVASHRQPADVFTVGEAASFGVKEIAENGNLAPLAEALEGDKHVTNVRIALGDPPPILPGESRTFPMGAGPGAKWFSWVSMLICTNDGFTGVDGIRLPKRVGDEVSRDTRGYDAGTEVNTEAFADMVPPCGPLTGTGPMGVGTGMSDPALAENDVIRHHPNIQGGADLLPGVHGWTDPVARIVIRRVS